MTTTDITRSTAYDRAVVEAAHHAAPIFAGRGWFYGSGDNAHIPDHIELMETLQRLVDNVRAETVELDEDGHGHTSTGTGRWTVHRYINAYTCDPSDDDISIMLELGSIEDPKIPKDTA